MTESALIKFFRVKQCKSFKVQLTFYSVFIPFSKNLEFFGEFLNLFRELYSDQNKMVKQIDIAKKHRCQLNHGSAVSI